jgi:hypothetical protein
MVYVVDFFSLHKLMPPSIHQKERSPGIYPGLRLVQGSEGCARENTPPPVVGRLGRANGVRNSVVCYGELCLSAVCHGAMQQLAQKHLLGRRPLFQVRQKLAEIPSRQALRIAFLAEFRCRQIKAIHCVHVLALSHATWCSAAPFRWTIADLQAALCTNLKGTTMHCG